MVFLFFINCWFFFDIILLEFFDVYVFGGIFLIRIVQFEKQFFNKFCRIFLQLFLKNFYSLKKFVLFLVFDFEDLFDLFLVLYIFLVVVFILNYYVL